MRGLPPTDLVLSYLVFQHNAWKHLQCIRSSDRWVWCAVSVLIFSSAHQTEEYDVLSVVLKISELQHRGKSDRLWSAVSTEIDLPSQPQTQLRIMIQALERRSQRRSKQAKDLPQVKRHFYSESFVEMIIEDMIGRTSEVKSQTNGYMMTRTEWSISWAYLDKRLDILQHVVDVVDRQAEGLRHPELPVVVLNHKEG